MNAVAFLDLAAACAEVQPELDIAFRRVSASGRYLFGEELDGFEAEFAAYNGVGHCAGVGSGFDALALGLRALGVRPGDEVLVPGNAPAVTWAAVAAVGAVPVGVEPDETTMTMDPAGLEPARTARTRAVVPVHLYGRPAAMDAVTDWARRHGVAVLADAAQAHGATFGGLAAGALADATAWSFYPSKNLGALGDGGAVTSEDGAVAARVRRLRNYGAEGRDRLVEVGTNSRLDELQAAFLRVRLRHLDLWNTRRRTAAARYRRELADLPLVLPPDDDAVVQSAWHLFVVRLSGRDDVRAALGQRGIDTLVHYPVPPFAQEAFGGLGVGADAFPVARRLAREVLSLPFGPHLAAHQQGRVIEELAVVLGEGRRSRAGTAGSGGA